MRNRFAHEINAIRRVDEIAKVDVSWLRAFNRDVVRKRDPISAYLRKARKFARRRKLRRIFYEVLFTVIAVLLMLLYFAIKRG